MDDHFRTRPERFRPHAISSLSVEIQPDDGPPVAASVAEVSVSGLLARARSRPESLCGAEVRIGTHRLRSRIVRMAPATGDGSAGDGYEIALAFLEEQSGLVAELRPRLVPAAYVTAELALSPGDAPLAMAAVEDDVAEASIRSFLGSDSPDLFDKCRRFHEVVTDLQTKGLYQPLYRVTLTTALDHRVVVFNPHRRREEEFVCFDSNSYLGLHLHPRVQRATMKALRRNGYGTPSAQLLSGTNRYLRELEETISRFHGREDTLVFPSGYAANVGAITGLVRRHDFVTRDRYSHASIHDACLWSRSRSARVYPHLDFARLEDQLTAAEADRAVCGKLVATDGVFSMHGNVVPLPELAEVVHRRGAKLLVDEAHATGILGANGRGTEELFGMQGTIDVLVGTFSKAPGTTGGYLCGTRELVSYLRFYANPAVFTASPPAALCAGVTEAFKVMDEEPEHREALWANVRYLTSALRDAGLRVSAGDTPILTIFVGTDALLWLLGHELFMSGIKCGTVTYPAVPAGQAVLRLAVNARHTREDLDTAVEAFARIGRKFDMLHRTAEELQQIAEAAAT